MFRLEIDDNGVGLFILDRPQRLNAVTWEGARQMVEALEEIRLRDDVKVLVLTGAGRAFCAGADAAFFSGTERPLPGLAESTAMPRHQRKSPAGPFAEVTRSLVRLDRPVIAALHGPVMGAGLAWALACDRRFADPTVRLCAAMLRLGFAPDCGLTYFLPRLTRLSTALMMVETGRVLDAVTAHREGLVDELVGAGGDIDAAVDYARELARGPSVAIDLGRRCVHRSQRFPLVDSYEYEATVCTLAARTEDAREGTRALLEKRPPRFRGR